MATGVADDPVSKRIHKIDAQIGFCEEKLMSCAFLMQVATQPAQRNRILREAEEFKKQLETLHGQRMAMLQIKNASETTGLKQAISTAAKTRPWDWEAEELDATKQQHC